MPTLRDLVRTLRQREGVAAALVVGHDGLLVDGAHEPGLDPDTLAAHVPPLLLSATAIGAASRLGPPERPSSALPVPRLLVCELSEGVLILTPLGRDAELLVLLRPEGDLPRMVHDLRRHRDRLSTLT
jgi:predicted regulator of Ras-like GTPase activity (Roadblock/LC7/MglB family)